LVKVVLENLTKKYGSTLAVDGIDVEIKDKEFFVLLGPSGCGKTTTLNMIAGLEPMTSGNIYFDGTLVNDIPAEKRDVAMVFQSYALYPQMNAYDNIAFPLKIRKTPHTEIKSRVEKTADMLHIRPLLKKKPHELSGGERQRVALARATVREPRVFLMDEPLSNIDAKLRVYMRAELIRLQKDLQTTTIYVTHDQVEAMSMADRVAIMNEGKVAQLADPMTIFNRPADSFVGGFVGTPPMNFFEAEFVKKGQQAFLQTSKFALKLDAEAAKLVEEKAAGNEITIGVRPQDITLAPKRTSDEDFEAEVYAVEPLGNETVVDLRVDDKILKVVASHTFESRITDEVWASVNKKRMHLFNKSDGKAVL
jgi:multiple sugar transport system ATP-binding protein